ncbi:uncharacterized protein LOC5501956 isoform X2 [Nematostella vectensis]|uniref:uncharacterized protein LOC5501956 isoform X2 n=1 Tax=Nematostella vectensis TaxID=45351 RepID=UPI0013900D77|nr:uncharacterized protein LOC5501956 isoform X2 [Nematostella vectensis]
MSLPIRLVLVVVVWFITISAIKCVQAPSLAPSKRKAICISVCSLLNGNLKSSAFSWNRKKVLVYVNGCVCSRDDQARERGKRSLKENVTQTTTTSATEVVPSDRPTLPGLSIGGIHIFPEDADLSKHNITTPDPNESVPSIPAETLKVLAPDIYRATKACPHDISAGYNGTNTTNLNQTVRFVKTESMGWYANVTWASPTERDIIESYLLMWHVDNTKGTNKARCRLANKDQTYIVLNETDGWVYPKVIYLKVIPLPRKNSREKFKLHPYYPKSALPIPVPRKSKADVTKISLAITIGVLSGVVIIILLLGGVYKWKCMTSSIRDEVYGFTQVVMENGKSNNAKADQDLFFASYYQESSRHTERVATMASRLREDGYNVIIDQFESVEINDLGMWRWVDHQMNKAKKVLVICSPGYVRLWRAMVKGESTVDPENKDMARVKYEINLIGNMYAERLSTANIICLNMGKKNTLGDELPPWMKHNTLQWPEQKDEVYRRLIDQRALLPIT